MADQMRCMGFDFCDEGDVQRFFDTKWDEKVLLDMADGVYLRMDVKPGLSCWLSVDPESHEILDWDMHYSNGPWIGCAFDHDVSLDEAGQSGNIAVLLDPGATEIPVTASVPCLAYWADREEGSPGLIQLAAYALSVKAVSAESEEQLVSAAQDNTARLVCTVISTEKLNNEYSGLPFARMLVRCCGQEMQLLCTDEMLVSLPAQGTRIAAECVLTAMVQSGVTE